MSKGKKKMRNSKYTREFRDSSVQLVLNSEESTAKIARDLDVNEKTLYNWVREYKKANSIPVVPRGKITSGSKIKESAEEENKRLRAEKLPTFVGICKWLYAKRFNVLGFISKKENLKAYIKESSVTSDTVIEVFDDFSLQLTKPTVATLDNASFHRSKKFKENIPKWANRGLTLIYLPPYSPELNIIEILWKFIKYHWIEICAYQSYTALKEYVQRMLDEYGSERIINFTQYEKKFYPLVVVN